MHKHEPNDWKKYIIVLFITSTIFISGLWVSNYFTNKKINQVKDIEDKISLDLMSSEVQFSLLEEISCKDISSSVLSSELSSLSAKISYSENNIGSENDEVISLKKYYTLLQIKDYLLMKKITARCGQKPIFLQYFYGNDCTDCVKQGYVLTSLSEKYPNLRVYSFDYNLDLSALKAMISIYKVPSDLPAIVIDNKVHSGFQTLEDIEKLIPSLVLERENKLKEEKALEAKLLKEKNRIKSNVSE